MVSPLEIWLPISTCFKPTRPSIGAVMRVSRAAAGRWRRPLHQLSPCRRIPPPATAECRAPGGDEVGLHQLLVTSEIAAGVGEGGPDLSPADPAPVARATLNWLGSILRQQVAGFDLLTLLEVKTQQLAVDPAADADGVLPPPYPAREIARDRFFGGGGRLHRRQRGAKAAMACAARPLRALPGGGSSRCRSSRDRARTSRRPRR